jgi:hypothetical protein
MHYKNEAMTIAMSLITPDMRKSSNKFSKISGGSRRANSKLRTATKETRNGLIEGESGSVGSQVGSPNGGHQYILDSNSMSKPQS